MLSALTGLFNLAWAAIFLYFGIRDLQTILGGTICFFYFLPIIAILTLRYREYAKILWSVNLTFIGIVLVNYLHSYFSIHSITINFLVLAYVIFIPFSFVFYGYLYLIQSLLVSPKSRVIENSEDMKTFKYFRAYTTLMISVPIILTLPIIDCFGHNKDIVSNGFEVASGLFISTMLMLLMQSRKISKETINYFAKPIPRTMWSLEKVKKIISIGTIVFIIFSAINELKIRQHWFIWSESIAILVMNILVLLKFGQVIFMPINIQGERPINFYFPVLKNRIITIITLSIVFMVVCALISQ